MLFVAMNVTLGTVGTPLEHSGKLEACQLLIFEEGLGSEENGALPGIAYNATQRWLLEEPGSTLIRKKQSQCARS